jgi:DNA polymerase I-like protein with 3'-5' exonuclease and polymerase domains
MTDLFPSLRGHGPIAIDLETRDEELKKRGPGYHRPNCYIVGVAVATAHHRHYYPVAHESGENLDRGKVFKWLQAQLHDTKQEKVFANSLYDLGFLAKADVHVWGPIRDVQVAEPLLDENQLSYSLDRTLKRYGYEGKNDEQMEDWIKAKFGKKNPKNNIWRAPVDIVAPYAIGDVVPLLSLYADQKKKLEEQNLWRLFEMESRLLPMLLAMRMRGVRVDLKKAERLRDKFIRDKLEVEQKARRLAGRDVQIWAAASIGEAFDALGLEYPRTPKTNAPSFTKGFLKDCPHGIAQLIVEARRLDKMVNAFLEGAILNSHVKGRVYTQFHSMKGDGGGTVTGRFSSSGPNLQQIPIRTADGKLIRSMFIPDAGKRWFKSDFSQIEFRLLAHDAACAGLPGAAAVVEQFKTDPSTDYHRVIAEMAGISRDEAKTINFGLAYGEGAEKLARALGLSLAGGEAFLKSYHRLVPFMRPLSGFFMAQANRRGWIETLMRRRRRFDTWELTKWVKGKKESIFSPVRRPGWRRAFTYAALNARVQGSAADVMKTAMINVWDSGVINAIGVPQLTVHDELDGSYPDTKIGREALVEMKRIQENCVKLLLPLKVDLKTGNNWGELE